MGRIRGEIQERLAGNTDPRQEKRVRGEQSCRPASMHQMKICLASCTNLLMSLALIGIISLFECDGYALEDILPLLIAQMAVFGTVTSWSSRSTVLYYRCTGCSTTFLLSLIRKLIKSVLFSSGTELN